jgi:hypothetical protein
MATMRAVRLSAPGPVDNLRLTTLPLPPERDGWVRIRVEAFGLNRSELKLRLGLGMGVSFPRVPGIEAAGTVDAAPACSPTGRSAASGRRYVKNHDAERTRLTRTPKPGRGRAVPWSVATATVPGAGTAGRRWAECGSGRARRSAG